MNRICDMRLMGFARRAASGHAYLSLKMLARKDGVVHKPENFDPVFKMQRRILATKVMR
jgi:hypothetical protein